jgi:septal ring factor EnvC (AmiA/AmiB activator)
VTGGDSEYRWRALEESVRDLRDQIRTFAPTSVQIGVLEATVEDIEREIAAIKADAIEREKRLQKLESDVRASPMEMLKLIFAVIAAFASLTAVILGIAEVAGYV